MYLSKGEKLNLHKHCNHMKTSPFPSLIILCLVAGLFSCKLDRNQPDAPRLDESFPPPNQTVQNEEPTAQGNPGIDEDYVHTDRVIWQKPDMVINRLGNLEDKVVADIGAGTGFFSLRLVQRAKKVIAVDIDPRFVEYLDSIKILELSEPLQSKLETRLATTEDPRLEPDEANVVVIVNTYMYLKDRVQYIKNLKKGMQEGGQLVIIDFKKKRTTIGPPQQIRVPLYQVEEELLKAGYSKVSSIDTALDYQYIVMAEK